MRCGVQLPGGGRDVVDNRELAILDKLARWRKAGCGRTRQMPRPVNIAPLITKKVDGWDGSRREKAGVEKMKLSFAKVIESER